MYNPHQSISRTPAYGRLSGVPTLTALAVFTLLISLIMGSCSGKGHAGGSDSVAPEEAPADTTADQTEDRADIPMTAEGVDRISVGMLTRHIPPESEGVYDSVYVENGYGSNTYLFFINGRPLFTAYEFTEGTVDVLSAESPQVVVVRPDGSTLRLGDSFAEVLELPGVEAVWENADDDGMWCWQWRGLWFQPDQSRLSEELSRRLYNDSEAPAASAFTPEIRIGYIGTGLPW